MIDLAFLFHQYELLQRTAQFLSAVDLFNCALACSDLNALILRSKSIFTKLKRLAVCGGTGLKLRQACEGIYGSANCTWKVNWKCFDGEEIEVRVFNRTCGGTDALPCLKCGVSICEVR